MRSQSIFSTVDAHVGGQAFRLVVFGAPQLAPGSLREQEQQMRDRFDYVRTWLLTEPRGYAGMTGAILVNSSDPDIDYGVIFMSGGGYKPMSGHGMIALATALIDSGSVPADGPEIRINFETLAGPIQARASVDRGQVRSVRFRNVPSFRLAKALEIPFRDRVITVDVAYGGNWYAIARAEDVGVALDAAHELDLKVAGIEISRAANAAIEMVHPIDPHLHGVFGTVILGTSHSDEVSSRNATVYLDGLLDRSPCGTGMSATMACLVADGQLQVGQTFSSESIIQSYMTGRVIRTEDVGGYAAVVTEIAGRGQITGMHQFLVDPGDPFGRGSVMP